MEWQTSNIKISCNYKVKISTVEWKFLSVAYPFLDILVSEISVTIEYTERKPIFDLQ